MEKITANLCKCNNCNTVLIDENPNTGRKYELNGSEKAMSFIKDDDQEMFWACPECLTDDYLIDL